ncbi:hypothetical protein GF337_00820, partial [candidate division KSB1 bacterium]|nr:hypothetical protein [candidate division KSB1 bacterium]
NAAGICLWLCLMLWGNHQTYSQTTYLDVDVGVSLGRYTQFWGGLGQASFNDGVIDEPNRSYFKMIREANSHGREVFNYFCTKAMYTDTPHPGKEEIGGYVYIENENGVVSYNWDIVDRHFDAILEFGLIPIVNFSFMPKKLASIPDKRNPWNNAYVSPPKSYEKWKDLVYETVLHLKNRYGEQEIQRWYFEVWNEPDLDEFFWVPHPDQDTYPGKSNNAEYFKLFDFTELAAHSASDVVRIGGPAIAGDIGFFIKDWYPHCISGTNYATGTTGTRVDFISRHFYGETYMKYKQIMKFGEIALKDGKELLGDDPTIIITENGPTPSLHDWLNTRYVAAWIVKQVDMVFDIADEYGFNYVPDIMCFWTKPLPKNFGAHFGVATVLGNRWNPQPEGIVKRPAFNGFDALGYLSDERISISGTSFGDPVHGIATRNADKSVEIILYHFNDDDKENTQHAQYSVQIAIKNIPFQTGYLQIFKIDELHSNAYTLWKQMGSPEEPTPSQLLALKSQDDLQLAEPMSKIQILNGTYKQRLQIQNNSVALIVISADNPLSKDMTPPKPPTGIEAEDSH